MQPVLQPVGLVGVILKALETVELPGLQPLLLLHFTQIEVLHVVLVLGLLAGHQVGHLRIEGLHALLILRAGLQIAVAEVGMEGFTVLQ